jgi:hypothetical protein
LIFFDKLLTFSKEALGFALAIVSKDFFILDRRIEWKNVLGDCIINYFASILLS